MHQNESGFALVQLLFLALLGTGLVAALNLSLHPAVFNSKANELPAKSSYETVYNPFGDPWASKKNPYSSIPVSLSVATIRSEPKNAIAEWPENEIDYYAKSNAPILYLDRANLQLKSEEAVTKMKNAITRIKAKNPNIKIIGYFVNHESNLIEEEVVARANAGEAYFEAFFVHKKNLPATKDNRVTRRPDHPEWGWRPLFDITNPNYRSYVIPKLITAMDQMGLDGVMMDSQFWNTLYLRGLVQPNVVIAGNEVPDDIAGKWPGAQAVFLSELKSAGGAGEINFWKCPRKPV